MKLRLIALTLLSLIVFSQESESNNTDPFEDINRIVFNISDDLDQAVLRPAAEFYSEYTPLFLKNGITNVLAIYLKLTQSLISFCKARFGMQHKIQEDL